MSESFCGFRRDTPDHGSRMQRLYQEQTKDIQELRRKTKELKNIAQKTNETIVQQNEEIEDIHREMTDLRGRIQEMQNKAKMALQKMGKKKATAVLGGVSTFAALFLLWWVLG